MTPLPNRAPSAAPVPKVTAATLGGGIGGAVAILVLGWLRRAGYDLSVEEMSAATLLISFLVSAIGAFVAGYVTPPNGFGGSDDDDTNSGDQGHTPPPPPSRTPPTIEPIVRDIERQEGARTTQRVLACLVAAIGLSLLTACAGAGNGFVGVGDVGVNLGNMSPEMRLIMTCRGYDATLRSLAGYRAAGKLSRDDVKAVEELRTVANPICTAPEPPSGFDLRAALDALEAQMQRALTIEQQAKTSPPPAASRAQ